MSSFPALVNRIPPGLLRLLGLQNTGRNPNQLAEFYQPVVEMRDWLFSQQTNWLQENFAVGIGANGVYDTIGAGLIVPQGEWWYVYDFNCDIAVAAASSFTVSPFLEVPLQGGAGGQQLFAGGPYRLTQNERVYCYGTVVPGVFLPPGSRPRCRISNGVGTATGIFNLTVARLPG